MSSQKDQVDQEPEVNGITRLDYQAWLRSPATVAFHKYLRDFAAALRRDHLERWEQRRLDSETEPEARGRINTLTEIEGLTFDHLLSFYEEPPQEPDDEGTDARNTETA